MLINFDINRNIKVHFTGQNNIATAVTHSFVNNVCCNKFKIIIIIIISWLCTNWNFIDIKYFIGIWCLCNAHTLVIFGHWLLTEIIPFETWILSDGLKVSASHYSFIMKKPTNLQILKLLRKLLRYFHGHRLISFCFRVLHFSHHVLCILNGVIH